MNIKEWHPMHVLNPGRKAMYIEFMQKLGGVPCYIPELQDARISCGTMPDGSLICALFNYSYDPLAVRFAVAEIPQKVERLTAWGMWEEVAFCGENGIVETALTQEPGVVGLYRLS